MKITESENMTMWRQKLGLSMGDSYGRPIPEVTRLLKDIGFDAISPEWDENGQHLAYIRAAKAVGLEVQSVHAPYHKSKDMWSADEEKGSLAVEELLRCVGDCADNGVGIMVAHAFIGFEDHTPTQIGLERYGRVVEAAQRRGVKIALENTEGEEYLAALMEAFRGNDTVGFCWDSGHEMCYNHSQDMLGKYGDRLLMTHLNDNLGIRDFDGRIVPRDELHLLPFDGIADWDYNVTRLKNARCPEILNFELNIRSKPGRYENAGYSRLTVEEYLTSCYQRACRVASRLIALG